MTIVLLFLSQFLAAEPTLEKKETPTTHLYVRTVPPGARLTLNGSPLGQSDGLFAVSPGEAAILAELDGYESQTRPVKIVAKEVTRVVLQLKKSPGGGSGSRGGSGVATEFIEKADLPAAVREGFLTVLRQHPDQARWAGRSGATLYAVAVKPLPSGSNRQRAGPAVLELTQMFAVQELLKAKVLLDRYAEAGLTDATTLAQAIENAAGRLHIVGRTQGVVHVAAVRGDFAVAYVLADESSLTAHLLNPVALDEVRIAYRDVMHRQAKELMQRSNWKDALLLWQHLHKRELVSQELYLDAARCFQQLGEEQDAFRVLTEALETFRDTATPEFLEQVGDLALAMKSDAAQAMAEKAYRLASQQLQETVSPAVLPDRNDGRP